VEIVFIGLIFLLLALFGTPLFVIIGAIALLSFHSVGIDTSAVIVEMYRISNTPALLAIPLFSFTGYILAESKTPQRLVDLSQALFGWIPGGLAVVALVSCAIFTAFTGASGITIIALGGLLFPAMLQNAYSEKFSLGLLTSCGNLGLLFPPSLPIILYALVAKININTLFVAGFVPGVLLLILVSFYCFYKGVTLSVPRTRVTFRNLYKAIKAAIWEIPLPIIVIGGIYGGLFTVTEAAAVSAFYVLIVEVFIYRDIKLSSDVPRIMKESMLLVGGILVILGTALGLTNYLIDAEIPMKILQFLRSFVQTKLVFLIMLNLFLLVVGCMLDIFSAIIVVVPLITPIALDFGVNPLHLGVIFLVNLGIGYTTPPVGMNLFIASFRFRKSILSLYAASLPFLAILLVALIIITYIPEISLWLVNVVGIK